MIGKVGRSFEPFSLSPFVSESEFPIHKRIITLWASSFSSNGLETQTFDGENSSEATRTKRWCGWKLWRALDDYDSINDVFAENKRMQTAEMRNVCSQQSKTIHRLQTKHNPLHDCSMHRAHSLLPRQFLSFAFNLITLNNGKMAALGWMDGWMRSCDEK